MKKRLLVFFLPSLALFLSACAGPSSALDSASSSRSTEVFSSSSFESSSSFAPAFELIYPSAGEMALVDEDVQTYFSSPLSVDAGQSNPDASYLLAASPSTKNCDRQTAYIAFKAAKTDTYTVQLSSHEDFSSSFSRSCYFLNGQYFASLATLYPSSFYYARVLDSAGTSPSGVFSFTTSDSPRFIDAVGATPTNFRDAGGYPTAKGKRIRYGMLYRGTDLDHLDADARKTLGQDLGIHSEVDLRSEGDRLFPSMVNMIDMNEPYYLCTLTGYEHNFTSTYEAGIKKLIEVAADSTNYPLYLHCTHGADRTGVALFLLEGLCGVSYEDLTRDYEMTSFASYAQLRDSSSSYGSWKAFYQQILSYGESGDSLMTCIGKFLLSIGVSSAAIADVRSLLVEKTSQPIINETYHHEASLKAPCHVSVTGGSVDRVWVEEGEKVTLTYTEVAGKSFGGWYDEDGKLLSSEATYTLHVDHHREISAKSV